MFSQLHKKKISLLVSQVFFKLPQDNCITVISGANGLVDREYVDQIADKIIESDVCWYKLRFR